MREHEFSDERTGANILIVEDEDKIAEVLRDYLRQHGYATERLARGDEVADWVRTHPVDLVLLDVMLPGQERPGGVPRTARHFRRRDHHGHRAGR